MYQTSSFAFTFASLTIILLCFFVFLNSVAEVSPAREKKAIGSIHRHFPAEAVKPKKERPNPLPALFHNLSEAGKTAFPAAGAENPPPLFEQNSDNLRVTFNADLIFRAGDDQVRAESLLFLRQLTDQLKNLPAVTDIEVHADEGVDGWALTLLQAASLYRLFIDYKVPRDRVFAAGFGAAHPLPDAVPEPAAPGAENIPKRTNRRVIMVFRLPPADADQAEAGAGHAL